MTNILVTEVNTSSQTIVISGIDIDKIVLNEDLYAEFDSEPVVKFSFNREAGPMKYLFKITASTNACKAATSFGAKLDKLVGNYLLISDNFKVTE